MKDLDRRIADAVQAGETERAAELLAARRALDEDATPNISFAEIANRVPIRRPSWRGWLLPAGGLAAATAVLAVVLLPGGTTTGIKSSGEACAPVELRVSQHGDAFALHPTVAPECRFTIHAVELGAATWRFIPPEEAGRVDLGPGRWVLVVIASPQELEPTRDDVIAVLNAVGEKRPPTISGEPVYVDVYDMGPR